MNLQFTFIKEVITFTIHEKSLTTLLQYAINPKLQVCITPLGVSQLFMILIFIENASTSSLNTKCPKKTTFRIQPPSSVPILVLHPSAQDDLRLLYSSHLVLEYTTMSSHKHYYKLLTYHDKSLNHHS